MFNARTLKIILFVIGLHLLVIYAVQSGLAHRVVTSIAPREIVATLIAPEVSRSEVRPQPQQPKPPKPQAPQPPPRAQQQQQQQPLAPQPAPSRAAPETAPQPARETAPVTSHPQPATASTETSNSNTPPAAPAAPAVSAAPSPPRRISMTQIQCTQVEPRYPSMSRRLGEEGIAVVRLTIGESGQVEKTELASSSGSPRLDQAALEAARAYKCQPFSENGQPLRANATQPFVFKLD